MQSIFYSAAYFEREGGGNNGEKNTDKLEVVKKVQTYSKTRFLKASTVVQIAWITHGAPDSVITKPYKERWEKLCRKYKFAFNQGESLSAGSSEDRFPAPFSMLIQEEWYCDQ